MGRKEERRKEEGRENVRMGGRRKDRGGGKDDGRKRRGRGKESERRDKN